MSRPSLNVLNQFDYAVDKLQMTVWQMMGESYNESTTARMLDESAKWASIVQALGEKVRRVDILRKRRGLEPLKRQTFNADGTPIANNIDN